MMMMMMVDSTRRVPIPKSIPNVDFHFVVYNQTIDGRWIPKRGGGPLYDCVDDCDDDDESMPRARVATNNDEEYKLYHCFRHRYYYNDDPSFFVSFPTLYL